MAVGRSFVLLCGTHKLLCILTHSACSDGLLFSFICNYMYIVNYIKSILTSPAKLE